MSESATGGEVSFVRLFLPRFNSWISSYTVIGRGFHAALSADKKQALVFVSPAPDMLGNITNRLGAVESQEATYAEWIESGAEKPTE